MWAGWVHHSRRFGHAEALRKVGTKMPKCRSKMSSASNVRANFGIFSAWSKWFSVTIGHKATINGSIAAHPTPKNFECKHPLENFSSWFLGSRRHPLHSLTSKGPNYQCRVLLISVGATEGHFEGKTPREGHQGGVVLARPCPGSPGTCNTEETGIPGIPVSWSPTLFSGSGPFGLPPVPWTEKKLKGRHFSSDA